MAAPALSFRRKFLFVVILTGSTAALLLGALELGLRIAGYGYSPHFTELTPDANGAKVWRENRWCTAPYFSPALVRRPLAFRLPERKAPGTYRIFVLGSSAAMGDPDPSFSFARVLEKMLRAAYPDFHFEVVNAAITAINSHLARGIAEDCANLEPDLFIVYEGHNEVIGPFGPAGVFTPFLRHEFAIRTAVWLKGTRTGQLFSAAGRAVAGRGAAPADWGGMQMFLKQQIPADDPRLDAVRARFRENLLAIAAAGHRAGATTLLCTVLTNQRDFAPFMSLHRANLSPADLTQWHAEFNAAENATRAGDLAGAEAHYRAANAIDDHYAETFFRLGRLALQTGRDPDAQDLLQRALDLDALRFRTDSSLNRIVRDLGATNVPGIHIMDLATTLATRSQHGVVGDDLLYEHVHLTSHGAYEVARELFPAVVADLVRRGFVSRRAGIPFDESEARIRLGFTTHEQAMIALELLNRFRAAPFTGQSDHAIRLATWQRRAEAATTLLSRPDALPALREIYRRALALAPDDWILARNAGSMLVARGAPADALPLLESAAKRIDDDVDTFIALGWAHRALGQSAAADSAFARARQLEPNYPGLPK